MSHISMIDYNTAAQDVRDAYDEEVRVRGRMTNMKRTLLHSPTAHRIYAEWFTLRDTLRPHVDDRSIWLFSHAISDASRSLIATTFFRRALMSAGFSPETLVPTEQEKLLIDFGQAIVADSNAIPTPIWAALKVHYDEATLVNLVAFAGIMLATAVFINVVEVEADPELAPYFKQQPA